MENISIDKILETAPAKISLYCEKENKSYADMITRHEQHKQLHAKKYLGKKVLEPEKSIKDIEYELDVDDELIELKSKEIQAEIEYRSWRMKKQKADDYFQSAMERGRNERVELKTLHDTILKKGV